MTYRCFFGVPLYVVLLVFSAAVLAAGGDDAGVTSFKPLGASAYSGISIETFFGGESQEPYAVLSYIASEAAKSDIAPHRLAISTPAALFSLSSCSPNRDNSGAVAASTTGGSPSCLLAPINRTGVIRLSFSAAATSQDTAAAFLTGVQFTDASATVSFSGAALTLPLGTFKGRGADIVSFTDTSSATYASAGAASSALSSASAASGAPSAADADAVAAATAAAGAAPEAAVSTHGFSPLSYSDGAAPTGAALTGAAPAGAEPHRVAATTVYPPAGSMSAVFYAMSQSNLNYGTIAIKIEADTRTKSLFPSLTLSGRASSATVKLTGGWTGGNPNMFRARATAGPYWIPNLSPISTSPSASAGETLYTFTGLSKYTDIASQSGLYFVLKGVTAPEGVDATVSVTITGDAFVIEGSVSPLTVTRGPRVVENRYLGFALTPPSPTSNAAATAGGLMLASSPRAQTIDGVQYLAIGFFDMDNWVLHWLKPTAASPLVPGTAADVDAFLEPLLKALGPGWSNDASLYESDFTGVAEYRCVVGTAAPSTCVQPNTGCSNFFTGEQNCYKYGSSVPNYYACNLPGNYGKSRAVPQLFTTACRPKVNSLTGSYTAAAASTLSVSYVMDEVQNLGAPNIQFMLRTAPAGMFDWTGVACTAPGMSCVAGTGGATVTVTLARLTGDNSTGSFVVPSDLARTAGSSRVIVASAVEGIAGAILTPEATIDLPANLGINTFPAAVVRFAPSAAGSSVGWLTARLARDGGAAISTGGGGLTQATVALPTGWQLPAQADLCSLHVRVAAEWPLSLPSVAATAISGGALTFPVSPLLDLAKARELTLVCEGVTAPAASDVAARVGISFDTTVPVAKFLVDPSPVKFETWQATDDAYYMGFSFTVGADALALTPAHADVFTGAVSGATAMLRQAGRTVYATLSFAGAARVFYYWASITPTTATALEAPLLAVNASAVSWAAAAAPYEISYTPGRYECGTTIAGYDTCRAVPAHCGSDYAPEACVRGVGGSKTTSEFACAIPGVAAAPRDPDYSNCAGLIEELTCGYSAAADTITVGFAVDTAAFSGTPSLVFTLRTEPEGLFAWDDSLCPAGVTCAFPASADPADAQRIAITVAAVTVAGGSFVLASPAAHWSKVGVAHVEVTAAGHPSVLVTGTLETAFNLGDVAVFFVATAPAASFAPAAAGAHAEGTLVVALDSGVVATALSSDVPLSGFSSATVGLPPGWSWAASAACALRLRPTSSATAWFYGLSSVAATSVSAGVLAFADAPAVDSPSSALYVVCEGVIPAAAGGSVTLSLEGRERSYLAEVTTAAALAAPVDALALPHFVAFTLTYDGAQDPTKALYSAALSSNAADVDVAFSRSGLSVAVTVGLSSGSRALTPVLALAAGVASLASFHFNAVALTWSYATPTADAETGLQGELLCATPGGGYSTCLVTPAGCSNVYQSLDSCVDPVLGTLSSSPYACAFKTLAPPTPSYATCGELITTVAAVYDEADAEVTVTLSVDTTLFAGTLEIVVSLTTDQTGVFTWAASECTSDAVAFVCTVDGDSLLFAIALTSSSVALTVPVAVAKWVDSGSFVVTAAASVAPARSIVAGDVARIPFGPAGVYTLVSTPIVSFALDSAGVTGTLAVSIDAGASALFSIAVLTAFDSVSITLPDGWVLGSACSLRVRGASDSHWPLALTSVETATVASGVLTFSRGVAALTAAHAVLIMCDGVIPAVVASGSVSVSFQGVGATYVARAPDASLSHSASDAGKAAEEHYIGFDLSLGAATDVATSTYTSVVAGGAAGLSLQFARDVATVLVTIGLAGGSRALTAMLSQKAALTGLAAEFTALASGAVAWSYDTAGAAAETGTLGDWLCASATGAGEFEACANAPANCSDTFQDDVTCVSVRSGAAAQKPSDYACAFIPADDKPNATPDYDGCTGLVTSLSGAYDASTGLITVSFAVDPALFVGQPTVAFTILTDAPTFDWSAAACLPSGKVSCSYAALSGSATAELVISTAAPSVSFTLASPVSRWAKSDVLTLSASIKGKGSSVIALGVPTTFPLSNVNVFALSAVVPAVSYAPVNATVAHTGRLAIALEAAAGAVVGGSADLGDFVTVTLNIPAGWAFESGATCAVRARTATADAAWILALPEGTAVHVSAAGVFSYSVAPAALETATALYITCDSVTAPAASPTVDAPVSVSFEGVGRVYLAEVSTPGKLRYDPAAAPLARRFIGFDLTLGSDTAVDAAAYLTAMAGLDSDVSLAFDRAATTVAVTVGLAGPSRAFESLLSRPAAVTSLALVLSAAATQVPWTAAPTPEVVTGDEGVWQCEAASVLAPCVITPIGCGERFQGDITCTTAGTESKYACALPSMPMQPPEVPDLTGCGMLVNALSASYAAEVVTVTFGLNEDLVSGLQDIVFTIATSTAGVFDWSAPSCTGGSGACTVSDGAVSVEFTDVAIGATFTIASPVARWTKADSLTVSATLKGQTASVIAPSVATTTFPITNVGVFALTGVTPAVSFAPADATASHTGRLAVALEAASGAVLAGSASLGGVAALTITIPSGWVFGSSAACTVRARTADADPAWLLALPQSPATPATSAGIVSFAAAPASFETAKALYIVCNGVTAPGAAATIDGPVAISFEGADRVYLAEVSAPGAVQYDPDAASRSRRFVGFNLTISASEDVDEADYAAAVTGSDAAVTFAFVRAATTVSVTVGLAGPSRAFEGLLSRPAAVTSLASVLSAAGAPLTWTFSSSAIATGDEGQWLCEEPSGVTPSYATCHIAQVGCGTEFQGAVTCTTAGAESAYACALPSMPERPPLEAESDACVPQITALTAAYDVDEAKLAVTFGIDPLQFIGAPTLSFVLAPNVTGLFDWAQAECSDLCAPLGAAQCVQSCEPGENGALAVTVQSVTAAGVLMVQVKPVRWSKQSEISVGVTRAGKTDSVIASSVSQTAFSLPVLLVDTLTALPVSAAFALASAEGATTGTLVVAIGGMSSSTALSTVGTANVGAIGLTLPAGWLLGFACSVRARSSTSAAWVPSLAPTTSAAVDAASGSITVALPHSVNAVYSLYVACTGVTPAEADAASFAVSLEGAGSAYLVEVTGGTMTVPAAPAAQRQYAGFTLTSAASVDESAIASSVLGSAAEFASLPVAVVRGSGDASESVEVTVDVTGGAHAFASLLTEPAALASLVTAVLKPAGAWTFAAGSADAGLLGAWLCGTDADGYKSCEFANSCGSDTTMAPVCVADATGDLAGAPAHACAFDEVPKQSDARGCGSWMCKDADGHLVDCRNVAVCSDGCAASVPVTPELIAADARFTQYCVVDGLVTADAPAFCPSPLVPAGGYREACDAVSTCRLSCMDAGGIAKSCDSDLTWSECQVPEHGCGSGMRSRHVYCSAETFPIATNTTAQDSVVPLALCAAETGSITRTETCSGAYCIEYAWQCDDGEGGLVDCVSADGHDIDTGYSGCDGLCGETTQTRNVRCVSYIAAKVVKSTTTDERFCLARAPKPAAAKPCASDSCDPAARAWKCLPASGNPLLAADCTGDFGFVCPASGCVAPSTVHRTTACFDTGSGALLDNAKCAHLERPTAVHTCTAVDDGCRVEFFGTHCNLDSTGVQLPAPEADEELCVVDSGDASGVFRRGICTDAVSGAVVAGACAEASLLDQCQFPVCGESPAVFTWHTEAAAACVPGCLSYRPVAVSCLASTDGAEAVAVDDSLCSAADRPSSHELCAASACEHSGACVPVPVFVDGAYDYEILGSCQCPSGFGGALCANNATFASFVVDPLERSITWAFTSEAPASMPFVTVTVTDSVNTMPVVLSVAPADAPASAPAPAVSSPMHVTENEGTPEPLKHEESPVDLATFAVGDYNARISGAAGAFDATTTFSVTGSCASGEPGTACVNGGTCNTDTGMCDCVGDFSGPTCAVSPCPARGCNPLTSWCDITLESTGVCVCRPGFTGALCDQLDTPCAAADTCLHGGWRAPVLQQGPGTVTEDVSAVCSGCLCANSWAGDRCQTCSLQCPRGFSSDADCSSCSACPAGRHGAACELSHLILKLNFRKSSAFDWYRSAFAALPATLAVRSAASAARARVSVSSSAPEAWVAGIERTLDALIRHLSPAAPAVVASHVASYRRLNDTAGVEYVQLTVQVGEREDHAGTPAAAAAQWSAHEALRRLRPLFLAAPTSDGLSAAEGMTAFAGLYLGRGVGMRDPACDSAAAGASCPAGTLQEAEIDEWKPEAVEDDPTKAGSASLSSSAAIGIGIGVAVGGLALLALAVLVMRKKQWGPFSSSSPEATAASAAIPAPEVEMTQQRASAAAETAEPAELEPNRAEPEEIVEAFSADEAPSPV